MAARGRQDHYEVLGVSPDAPDEVIRAAYRALVAKYHPDRNPADKGAELQLKRLNAAFAVLGASEKRRQYDELTRSPDDSGERYASDRQQPSPAHARSRREEDTSPRQTCWNCSAQLAPNATKCEYCGERSLRKPHGSSGAFSDPEMRTGPKRPIVLATLLKVIGALVLAYVVCIVGIAWYSKGKEEMRREEEAAVSVDAAYNPQGCSQDHPILLVVSNRSKRIVKEVAFGLQAYEPGRSEDLASPDSAFLTASRIVRPGKVSRTCWSFPQLKRNASVLVRAEKSYTTFYEAAEYVPPDETN
jgi:ribosomal protein L40E